MEKISLQKKSFFNSIGLDINNLPAELKIKASSMQKSLAQDDISFLEDKNLAVQEEKYFRIRNLAGTNKIEYDGKTWLDIFANSEKSDEIIKLYFKNPNYYFKDLRKIDQGDTDKNEKITLYEDDGKFYIKDGIGRLSLMMIKYLLEMSRASSKEERVLINKQYIFAANVISMPKDKDIVYLIKLLNHMYGSKIKIKRSSKDEECSYTLTYGEKVINIKSKQELENFIKSSCLPKEYKTEERLKQKMSALAQISIDYESDSNSEEIFLVIGKIFPNYEIFVKYYKRITECNLEDRLYNTIDLKDVKYEQVLKNMINIVKQEELNQKKKAEKAKKDSKLAIKEQQAKKVVSKKKESEVSKKVENTEIRDDDTDILKKRITDQIAVVNNSVEMMYYKLKTEESKFFELANQSDVALNIDRISEDAISSSINQIKSHFLELENSITNEGDVTKLKNINSYIKELGKKHIKEDLIVEYKEEMMRVYSSCLNKHVQKIITESKLDKLDIQKEEIEKEKCSFFSKLIGKAKLKQAKLDNINLKRQLILSESQYADKLYYYIEDGLSDLYAYIKGEEVERCLSDAKSFIRKIESNMQIQNLIDNVKLNNLIKEKVEQKKNLPQLALSKEKRRLFSKTQINLMEEKNNELKRVIQITRANSLKQQNTGLVPILGNIKSTKTVTKFCSELDKMGSEIRSLI